MSSIYIGIRKIEICVLTPSVTICLHFAVKITGKLQDGTIFLKKGHDNDEELFEFKTDEGSITYLTLGFSVVQLLFLWIINLRDFHNLSRASH